jgi:hypothetical protein
VFLFCLFVFGNLGTFNLFFFLFFGAFFFSEYLNTIPQCCCVVFQILASEAEAKGGAVPDGEDRAGACVQKCSHAPGHRLPSRDLPTPHRLRGVERGDVPRPTPLNKYEDAGTKDVRA